MNPAVENLSQFEASEREFLKDLVDEGNTPNGGEGQGAGQPEAPQPAASQPTAPQPEATAAAPAAQPSTAAPAAQPNPTPADTAAPAAAEPAPPRTGDTRAALRAARAAEQRARREAERLRNEIEELRQGRGQPEADITDEELAQLEQDFPLQAKVVKQQRLLAKQLKEQQALQQQEVPEDFEPPYFKPEVQAVIDGVPDLLEWQYDPNAQDKFARAVEYDSALALDPDWKNKPVAERFAEAAKRTREAFGQGQPAPTGDPTPKPAAPAATRIDPAVALANAQETGPKGISDFRGGPPSPDPTLNYSRMTDEQIMASLPAS